MRPARRDLEIYQGDTYAHVVTIQDLAGAAVDITSRTYVARLKNRATDAVVLSFTAAVTDGANGQMTVSATAVATAALTPDSYAWDLQETNGSTVTTILAGIATVVKDVG